MTWAEQHGVAENWPEWAALLVRCRQGDGYYDHAYSFYWVYRYDGVCPYHPDGFDRRNGGFPALT